MQQVPRAAFHTLGCKLNFSETSAIARQVEENGFLKVDFGEAADVYVINTCSVTGNADRECKLIINRALAKNPDAFIIVTGCYAQLKPTAIARIPGVDLVLGAREKFSVQDFLADLKKKEQAVVMACEIGDVNYFRSAYSLNDRTRAFLKVQDGCDYSCSFCTIPLARGGSRSDTVNHVIHEISQLAAKGIHEIVLTGVNLGDFGKPSPADKHEENFTGLVKAIDQLDIKIRIRISSIEPNLLNKEIIDMVSVSDKFMPHFHIPLQSGSDRMLKLMKRRYLRKKYADHISYIKSVMPHCCIGADVIVGFPGETEEDFSETYDFINSLDISYLHVFTYSERDHTPAALMADAVPHGMRKERNRRLRILSEKKLQAFYRSQEYSFQEVLFETCDKNGFISGYTGNYIRVTTTADSALEGTLQQLMLQERDEAGHFVFNAGVAALPA